MRLFVQSKLIMIKFQTLLKYWALFPLWNKVGLIMTMPTESPVWLNIDSCISGCDVCDCYFFSWAIFWIIAVASLCCSWEFGVFVG